MSARDIITPRDKRYDRLYMNLEDVSRKFAAENGVPKCVVLQLVSSIIDEVNKHEPTVIREGC